MCKFKIEKNIPIPIGSGRVWPFAEMEVNDSFLVPMDIYSRDLHSMAANAARNCGRKKNPNWKFMTRKVDGGVRVWRVE